MYYRGVRQVAQIVEKHSAKIQDLTYRGAKMIERVKESASRSTMPHMYRGVAY